MPWKGWCMQICFPCHALKSLSLSLSNSQENDATAQKHIHEYRDYYSETSLCGKQELNSFSLSRWRRRSLPLIRHPTLVMIIMGSFFIVQYSMHLIQKDIQALFVKVVFRLTHSLTIIMPEIMTEEMITLVFSLQKGCFSISSWNYCCQTLRRAVKKNGSSSRKEQNEESPSSLLKRQSVWVLKLIEEWRTWCKLC